MILLPQFACKFLYNRFIIITITFVIGISCYLTRVLEVSEQLHRFGRKNVLIIFPAGYAYSYSVPEKSLVIFIDNISFVRCKSLSVLLEYLFTLNYFIYLEGNVSLYRFAYVRRACDKIGFSAKTKQLVFFNRPPDRQAGRQYMHSKPLDSRLPTTLNR